MTREEISKMYPGVPTGLFRDHNWRDGFTTLGIVPNRFVKMVTENRIKYEWPAQVANLIAQGNHDLILSIGQVVPHEVSGMANYNKNVFVGTGGAEGINKSHFIGAVYGMERIMGRAANPVRKIFNYASDHFTNHLPIVYILTVIGFEKQGKLVIHGLFIGDDLECFHKASELSLKVNLKMVEKPLQKVVVFLDPMEFKSTWLGNKSIYRTRMAIGDQGELIVLAPGVKSFGEDDHMDRLIRQYGYIGMKKILKSVDENDDLKENLGGAAHLIHGSSEGRFSITYCTHHLSKEEIEQINFRYCDLDSMIKKYDPAKLSDGWNTLESGENIYYISNPANGLWVQKEVFQGLSE